MPNRDVHVKVGMGAAVVATTTAAGVLNEELSLGEIFMRTMGALVGGYIGARVPDIIDPSTNGPRHRSIGHAVVPNGAAYVLLHNSFFNYRNKLVENENSNDALMNQFIIGGMDGLFVGHASHLILDSQTPFSLPLIR